MGFRSASILTLIISGIIIGCTDAVSTNYHDRTSYYSDKAIETQYVSSSERTSDVSEDIRRMPIKSRAPSKNSLGMRVSIQEKSVH